MTPSDPRGAAAFLQARDFLLRHREDYPTAYRDFRWPELGEFNWALDYFDPMASGNEAPALCIVDEQGMPAYLEATTERNKRLYERYGFEVTGEIQYGSSPAMWPMYRKPRG